MIVLIIGRPVLNGQWNDGDFPTRDIGWQERIRNERHQVHTYPAHPFFDIPTARQLLASTTSTTFNLFVSFLELDYQQCTSIVDGLTILLSNRTDPVGIYFRLEYETGNVEHQDAVQQAEVITCRCLSWLFLTFPNVHIETIGKLSVSGDESSPTEEDSPPEDDDDD